MCVWAGGGGVGGEGWGVGLGGDTTEKERRVKEFPEDWRGSLCAMMLLLSIKIESLGQRAPKGKSGLSAVFQGMQNRQL